MGNQSATDHELENLRERNAELLAQIDELKADRDWWKTTAKQLTHAVRAWGGR